MLRLRLIGPAVPDPPKWQLWQTILGYLRRLLNLGNAAGFLPSRKPGILPPKDPRS